MNITEIELVGDQSFSLSKIKYFLSLSTPYGGTLAGFNVNYLEQGNQRVIILTDINNEIAAFASFEIWNNGKVWQSRNAESFNRFKGNALVAKIYCFVKNTLHKSLQSDTEQSYAGRKLWVKTLPSLGLHPMIFDTKTERIIDPATSDIDVYAIYDDNDPTQWRYTWIVERNDHYPSQNLLTENSLLMPVTGLWKNNKEK